MNKRREDYRLYLCYNFIKRTCSVCASFHLNMIVFFFSYLCSIDVDANENYVHPFHIIVDRNQGFIFFIETISYSRTKN